MASVFDIPEAEPRSVSGCGRSKGEGQLDFLGTFPEGRG
jgi:hypothetical protein